MTDWRVVLPVDQNRAPVFDAPNGKKFTVGLDEGEVVTQIGDIEKNGIWFAHWKYPEYPKVWSSLDYFEQVTTTPPPPTDGDTILFPAGSMEIVFTESGQRATLITDATFRIEPNAVA